MLLGRVAELGVDNGMKNSYRDRHARAEESEKSQLYVLYVREVDIR